MQFVTQNNQAYCGVASIVMVLNALSIPAPVAQEYSPYHVFTQDNFFNKEQTKKVLSPESDRTCFKQVIGRISDAD